MTIAIFTGFFISWSNIRNWRIWQFVLRYTRFGAVIAMANGGIGSGDNRRSLAWYTVENMLVNSFMSSSDVTFGSAWTNFGRRSKSWAYCALFSEVNLTAIYMIVLWSWRLWCGLVKELRTAKLWKRAFCGTAMVETLPTTDLTGRMWVVHREKNENQIDLYLWS